MCFAVLDLALMVMAMGKLNLRELWNNEIMPVVIISLAKDIFLIIIGIGILKGRNWARQFWLWLWFPYLLLKTALIKAAIGAYPKGSLIGDLLTAVWFVSLFLLNKSEIKTYFRQGVKSHGKRDKEDSHKIDGNLVLQIRKNMEGKKTDELVEILKQNDRTQYTKEALEAIRQILKERGRAEDLLEPQ
jgi:hypothetical protein